ncbi:YgfZ/GcvT domain-containing protein [Actinomyces gaoshouyii]|uniref:CAF17-like 4Fe-4S cluster assembly/insertion protein YgfZ n=1 Tax=Actinomyces gaoshouyii TaxID=1960083 RepID=UPI0009BDA65A|nr:folate-binding protein YgfZ [Actinomyces gaoshouyii]ARD42320.1 folate-binding protein YgfZ [Actinomyces gaoshouyii]
MRRSPLLDWPEAIAEDATSPDAAVPAHYGNPLREQAALADGQAIAALARDVVAVSGPDRLSWLTTLTTQVLTSLAPGDGGAEALILDAQGRIRHALAVLDDGATAWVVVDAGGGPALVEHLERMRFTLRVEVSPRDDVAALGALGSGATALEEAVRAALPGGDEPFAESDAPATLLPGAPMTWRDPWPGVVDGGTSYDVGLETSRHPGEGYRAVVVLAPAGRVPDIARSFLAGDAGRRMAGALAWEALRVEAGRPRRAREADERAIPHELDWLRTAVHLDKGCYPGQETVARTLNLGRPPRRLCLLQLDGLTGQAPLPGAPVRLGERVVGAVTSVARHHELGPIALALLRRGVPVDAPLLVDVGQTDEPGDAGEGDGAAPPEIVGAVDAAQEPLVSPEGRAQASPAERPGAGLRAAGRSIGLGNGGSTGGLAGGPRTARTA